MKESNYKEKKPFPYAIRDLTTEDLEEYNALLRYAFQVTEQELTEAGWNDNDEIQQAKFPIVKRADILGCYDGDSLISQFAVYPLKMNVYQNVYSIGFVTSVCTYPEYTGQGIIRRLMHQSLERMRGKKQTIALLYPFSIPLYRKFGWEIISNKISFRIKDYQIPDNLEAEGHVRRVDWDNVEFMELHSQFAQQTHGCLFRNVLAWEEYWRWDEEDTTVAVYYSAQDKPMGYMVYLLKDDIMHIKEIIYLNREAHRGLWEYIYAHKSMVDEVQGNTYYDEPVAFDMADGAIRETIRPYIMGRIVDVAEFFRRYRCNPKAPETVFTLEIEDNFLEWNDRTFHVRFRRGKCSLTREKGVHRLRMSINTLSTLLLGYKTAGQLAWRERIEGSEEAVECLDNLLLHEMPYISDYI